MGHEIFPSSVEKVDGHTEEKEKKRIHTVFGVEVEC